MSPVVITAVENVPDDSSYLFRVRGPEDDVREAILVRLADGVACWINECQHFTHISLDKGDGAPIRDGEIVCANHGAMFEQETGKCTFGPCEGAYLPGIDTAVEDGDVVLTDPDFAYVGDGPIDDGGDLTSTSNVEF